MLLFDFGAQRAIVDWTSVNDAVMGGLSSGAIQPTDRGTAVFVGNVSLENNGGFASIRTRPRPVDLSPYSGLELRFTGDGRRYKINLRTELSPDDVLYRAVFDTRSDVGQTVRFPFERFVPTLRGRQLRDAPPLCKSKVTSFGLMISDGQVGPFRLELERLLAYSE